MEKLSMYSARNFNKRLKRRDATNKKLKEITAIQKVEFEQKEADFKDTIDEKDEIIARLNEKLDSALEAKAQKLKSYYKSKAMFEKKEGKGHPLSKVSELKSRIVELENDVEVLQEEIQEFLKTPAVKTFQNGKYTDEMRAVYEDLLCRGVGTTENVQHVVRTVIEKLAGLEYGRLPQATFARYMYIEARHSGCRKIDGWMGGRKPRPT